MEMLHPIHSNYDRTNYSGKGKECRDSESNHTKTLSNRADGALSVLRPEVSRSTYAANNDGNHKNDNNQNCKDHNRILSTTEGVWQ